MFFKRADVSHGTLININNSTKKKNFNVPLMYVTQLYGLLETQQWGTLRELHNINRESLEKKSPLMQVFLNSRHSMGPNHSINVKILINYILKIKINNKIKIP